MKPKVTFPLSKIDFALLLNQKDKLVELRTQYPDCSDAFELLSGVIHLLDFIGDHIDDAISKTLICITNYDNWTCCFIISAEQCPEKYRDIYETTLRHQDYIKQGHMDAIPANMFDENHWRQFQRYGLNQEFKVPQETESENK